jgi:hypothetical protein
MGWSKEGTSIHTRLSRPRDFSASDTAHECKPEGKKKKYYPKDIPEQHVGTEAVPKLNQSQEQHTDAHQYAWHCFHKGSIPRNAIG